MKKKEENKQKTAAAKAFYRQPVGPPDQLLTYPKFVLTAKKLCGRIRCTDF